MSHLNKKYSCSQKGCSAKFARWDRFEIHVRTHSGERPFACSSENCDKRFASSSHLKRHEVAHQTSFRCPEKNCSEILKTKDTLRKHLDVYHHKKKHKKFKCLHCDEEFNKHNWLQRHMFKHTGDHPHKCPIEGCGKGFLMPSRLKAHMRIHAGYTCGRDNCDKVMTTWSLYLKHIRENHPAEYRCDICDRVFALKSNLKQHKAVHEESRGVFPCAKPNCSRFYHSIKNLNWHVRHYHDARPYVCDREHCHKGFKTEEKLFEHVMTHIRRKPRKKKKPKPSFIALLSGCAQKRTVNRKPRYQSTTTESSAECCTDSDDPDFLQAKNKKLPPVSVDQESAKSKEEPVASTSYGYYQSTTTKSSADGCTDSDSLDSLQTKTKELAPESNDQKLTRSDEEPVASTSYGYLGSTNLETKHTLTKPNAAFISQLLNTSVQSNCKIMDSVTSPEYQTHHHKAYSMSLEPSASPTVQLLGTSMQCYSGATDDKNLPEHRAYSSSIEKSVLEASSPLESRRSNSDSIDDLNSSEYETITVSLYTVSDYKNSESDISSCLSESEDFINRDMRASRQ